MSRPCIVLVAFMAAARSAAAGGPAAGPPDVFAAAGEQVRAGCKVSPKSCGELTAIYAGYRAEMDKLVSCESRSKKCTPEAVLSSFRAAETLDLRENALPVLARYSGSERPLLRLSLLLSKTAAAAFANVGPQDSIENYAQVAAYAPKDVNSACVAIPQSDVCIDALESLSDAQLVVKLVTVCERKPANAPCRFDTLESIAKNAENAMRSYEHASASTQVIMSTLFSLIKLGEARLAVLIDRDMKRRGDELDAGIAGLSSSMAALPEGRGDALTVTTRYNALSNTYREVSLESDRVASFEYFIDDTTFRERLNGAATQLAAARAKLAGLAADKTAKSLMPSAAGSDLIGEALAKESFLTTPAELLKANPSKLDRRLIPSPPPDNATAPPIIPGDPGGMELAKNIYSDDPLKAADARRRVGLSYTVGDPSGRAFLVHTQGHADTCAIVVQQEILTSLHLVPDSDPVRTEEALADEALKSGFFRSGTPRDYTADLLTDRNIMVAKRTNVPFEDLDAAARRGGMIIANVDARRLWNIITPGALGHAIVITGVEINRISGKTTGYYINDSGTTPPGRGRFIPAETLRKAWDGFTKNYAEVR